MRSMTLSSLRRHAALWLLCALAAAASPANAANATDPPPPPHHRSGGLQNNTMDFAPRGTADFLRWRWNALRQGLGACEQIRHTRSCAPGGAARRKQMLAVARTTAVLCARARRPWHPLGTNSPQDCLCPGSAWISAA